jgi:outer membrane protein OmpA-like peptidoglycan-associated protein
MREKPNEWVSIADLMSGVVAVVILLFVIAALQMAQARKAERVEQARQVARAKQGESAARADRLAREQAIGVVLQQLEEALKDQLDAEVHDNVIDFGESGKFPFGKSTLEPAQSDGVRQAIRKSLPILDTPLGQQWIKQLVVIGYADGVGDYLENLNLSLMRGERVLCELIAPAAGGKIILTERERQLVRDRFLASGYSFNSLRPSDTDSRRVEIRLEFWQLEEKRPPLRPAASQPYGRCRIT